MPRAKKKSSKVIFAARSIARGRDFRYSQRCVPHTRIENSDGNHHVYVSRGECVTFRESVVSKFGNAKSGTRQFCCVTLTSIFDVQIQGNLPSASFGFRISRVRKFTPTHSSRLISFFPSLSLSLVWYSSLRCSFTDASVRDRIFSLRI